MPQRTSFTTISPLPPSIRRAQAVAFLQDHLNMIDLNPLVKRRVPIDPPAHCPDDERHCTWYSITDSISLLPGGLYDGEVHYTAAFHDLPGKGMQSHSYAAMGVEIQGKWTVGGNEPGEKPEKRELGSEAPIEGLYLREECEVKCNMMMTRFIKKTIVKSHGKLMNSLIEKATLYSADADRGSESRGRRQRPPHVHPSRSQTGRSASPSLPSPTERSANWMQSGGWGNMTASAQRRREDDHPQQPFATSSDFHPSQQQQRHGQDAHQSRRPHAEQFYQRLEDRSPVRPYLSSDIYLGQQEQQSRQAYGYSNATAARSTPGFNHYSNGPHQGGHVNAGVVTQPRRQAEPATWPPAYTPGPSRQMEFAELA